MTIFQQKGTSYAKNEYNPFYQKFDAKYFHDIYNFFGRSSNFWENCKKLFWERIWPFLRKGGFLGKKLI